MKRKKKKSILMCICIILLFLAFSHPASAQASAADATLESDELNEAWQTFVGEIPPEVAELLPTNFFSGDIMAVGKSVAELSTPAAVFRVVGKVTGVTLLQSLSLLAGICGILVLCATFRAITLEKQSGTGRAVSLITALAITLLLFSGEETRFAQIDRFFDTVRALCLSLLPLMGLLYAMGGNVGAAVANHGVMSGFLAILETVCSGAVIPVANGLLALAVIDAVSGKASLRALATLVRRTFTWGLSFFMMLLTFVLGTQQTLAKGSDTLALRTVRFAAGSFLPVVGGSVSESLRTVAGSVSYLRGVVGTGGIFVVFFLFLPCFLSVLITRLAFLLGGAVAGLLSCPREEKLLGELAGIWGYFLAVIACLFVMTVFSLTLLAHAATAI